MLYQCYSALESTINEKNKQIIQSYGFSVVAEINNYEDICSKYYSYLVEKARNDNATANQQQLGNSNPPLILPRVLSLRAFRFSLNVFYSLRNRVTLSRELNSQYIRRSFSHHSFSDTLLKTCLLPTPLLNECMPTFLKEYMHTTFMLFKALLRDLSNQDNIALYNKNKDAILSRIVSVASLISSDDVSLPRPSHS